MTVTNVEKDLETLTMTFSAVFAAPITRVWAMWANPRDLERWWGPPTYPATFEEHALSPGADVSYFMTGPEGDRQHGWWRVLLAEAPHRLEFENGLANEDGTPRADTPSMTVRVTLHEESGRTRMEVATTYPSSEAMNTFLAMGMEEGMTLAMGQIDALL